MAIIAPSLLSADFLHLDAECTMLNQSQADWFHLDIMDGNFVPNISFGPMIVEFIRKTTTKFLDVHLMIENPEKYISIFKKAGADLISVHIEACRHLHSTLSLIQQEGMQTGIAINPHTPIEALTDILHLANLVCVMSVNPGFGGQSFIPHTYEKVKKLKQIIQQKNLTTLIEIDGGVTAQNAPLLLAAGADVLVAGNTVFKAENPTAMIALLKSF